jgi:photosystem II stability/assembly factor-like uncharacterized protein
MPSADPHRLRRRVVDVVLVLLVPAVLAFAFGTYRGRSGTPAAATPAAPQAAVTRPSAATQARLASSTAGAVWTGADGTTLVALTSGDCVSGNTTRGRLMLRAPGRTFAVAGTVPLAEVTALDAAGRGTYYASGLDAQCHRVHLATSDGGRSWSRVPALDKVSVVDHVGAKVAWGLTDSANAQVVRTTDGVRYDLVTYPCPADIPSPRLVTAVSADVAWVVCAGSQIRGNQPRLLYGTTDGGRTWRELSGARRSAAGGPDGLDGDGDLRAIGFTSARHGWANVITSGCRVGEVRVTSDGGRTWIPSSCPTASGAPLDKAFGVSFRDARNGLLAGIGATGDAAYATADAGRTWRPVS